MSKITDNPQTISSLSAYYGVSTKTFKKWLRCDQLKHLLDEKIGNYFTIGQVKEIVIHLDTP